MPAPRQKCPTAERGKHLRLQRDLRLGPGRGQEAEEPERHPRDSPGPHPPHANHQQGDRPVGCGGSLLFLLPLGGSHTAPAMLPGWVPCRCGAEPRGDPGRLLPGNVGPVAGCRQGSPVQGGRPKTRRGPSSVGTHRCGASLRPEEWPCGEGAPCREPQRLRNPLPAP